MANSLLLLVWQLYRRWCWWMMLWSLLSCASWYSLIMPLVLMARIRIIIQSIIRTVVIMIDRDRPRKWRIIQKVSNPYRKT